MRSPGAPRFRSGGSDWDEGELETFRVLGCRARRRGPAQRPRAPARGRRPGPSTAGRSPTTARVRTAPVPGPRPGVRPRPARGGSEDDVSVTADRPDMLIRIVTALGMAALRPAVFQRRHRRHDGARHHDRRGLHLRALLRAAHTRLPARGDRTARARCARSCRSTRFTGASSRSRSRTRWSRSSRCCGSCSRSCARPMVNVAVTIGGFMYTAGLGAFAGLLLTSSNGVGLVLGVAIPVIAYDVFGYFVGSQFGSRSAPAIFTELREMVISSVPPTANRSTIFGGVVEAERRDRDEIAIVPDGFPLGDRDARWRCARASTTAGSRVSASPRRSTRRAGAATGCTRLSDGIPLPILFEACDVRGCRRHRAQRARGLARSRATNRVSGHSVASVNETTMRRRRCRRARRPARDGRMPKAHRTSCRAASRSTATRRTPRSTGSRSRRARCAGSTNVRAEPRATLLVDFYDEDWTALWWVRVDASRHGSSTPSRVDRSVHDTVALLQEKYEQYRRDPPAGPVVALDDHTVARLALSAAAHNRAQARAAVVAAFFAASIAPRPTFSMYGIRAGMLRRSTRAIAAPFGEPSGFASSGISASPSSARSLIARTVDHGDAALPRTPPRPSPSPCRPRSRPAR